MTRRDKIEALARWLNDVCVDWPPISTDWDSKLGARRREEMRKWARDALEKIEPETNS